jgi:hypothetical protein
MATLFKIGCGVTIWVQVPREWNNIYAIFRENQGPAVLVLVGSINGEVCTWRYQYDSEQDQVQDAVPLLTNPIQFFSRFPLSFHDACVQLRGNDWKEIFMQHYIEKRATQHLVHFF